MSLERLQRHREAWSQKPGLRRIYREWFGMITAELEAGISTELGSGPGFFKEYFPACIASDIITSPWIDCVLDAGHLPFKTGSLANIILIDVIHHLQNPVSFFNEAVRVLKPGGKIFILDVQITPFSYFIYRFFSS